MTRILSRPATATVRLGGSAGFRAKASITPAGLLAVGCLVSGILLSTAVLVRAAKSSRDSA